MCQLLLWTGCSSHTLIQTDPPGAKVYIDGLLRGTSPLEYSDRAISEEEKKVILKKEGYETEYFSIRKEKFKWGPFWGGVFCAFPFIWILGYPPGYFVELEKTPEWRGEQ